MSFSPSYKPNVYNFAPRFLPNWRRAKANWKAKTANARILVLGDSTAYTANPAGGTGDGSLNWPSRLATLFAKDGTTAWNGFIGNKGSFENITNNTTVTKGSSWTNDGSNSIGGAILGATTNTNALSLTPTVSVTTFRVYYITSGSQGIFNMDIDGGTATPVNANGAVGVASATITAAVGAHTLNIKWSSGAGGSNIIGAEAWDDTVANSTLFVSNAGWGGSKAADWKVNTNPYNPSGTGSHSVYTAFNSDLAIILLGRNDCDAVTGTTQFLLDMQTIITAAANGGKTDVMLMTMLPANPASSSVLPNGTQDNELAYNQAIMQLAMTNGCVVADVAGRWGSYAFSSNTNFNFYTDTFTHPNVPGCGDIANFNYDIIGGA